MPSSHVNFSLARARDFPRPVSAQTRQTALSTSHSSLRNKRFCVHSQHSQPFSVFSERLSLSVRKRRAEKFPGKALVEKLSSLAGRDFLSSPHFLLMWKSYKELSETFCIFMLFCVLFLFWKTPKQEAQKPRKVCVCMWVWSIFLPRCFCASFVSAFSMAFGL